MVRTKSAEIETARLRPFAPEDLDAIHSIWVEPEVRRYLWDEQISRERAEAVLAGSVESCGDRVL